MTAARSYITRRRRVLETSSRARKPFKRRPTYTQKNKYELDLARKIGGDLTAGSGATFSDGDMRVDGKFLIEHKFRDEETVILPYSVFEKIRSQADRRGLIPVLVVTNKHKRDYAVMRVSDFGMADTLITAYMFQYKGLHPRRTIVVDPFQSAPNAVAYLNITCEGARELCMITLDDFRRISKTIK